MSPSLKYRPAGDVSEARAAARNKRARPVRGTGFDWFPHNVLIKLLSRNNRKMKWNTLTKTSDPGRVETLLIFEFKIDVIERQWRANVRSVSRPRLLL